MKNILDKTLGQDFASEWKEEATSDKITLKKINWLPIKNKVDQCIATVYNFKNNLSPVYMSDIYTLNSSPVVKTRRSVDSFVEPIYLKEISRKSVSYLGSNIWNGLAGTSKLPPLRTALNKPLKNNS